MAKKIQEEQSEIVNKHILKNVDIEKLKAQFNQKYYNHSNLNDYDEYNHELGCIPTPRNSKLFKNDFLTYLYVITYVDKHAHNRPEQYRWNFYDKKIGIAYDVEKRISNLQHDIHCGKRKKKDKTTLTPVKVESIKCWKLFQSDCFRFERYLHKFFIDRHIEGEWYADYESDIISIIESEIVKFVNNGGEIYNIHIDDDMKEHIHKFENLPDVVEKDDYQPYVIYRL
jgi:hypothetical protein